MKSRFNKFGCAIVVFCTLFLFSSCNILSFPTDFSSVELKYENNESRYYYNLLTNNAKTAYTLILDVIETHPQKIEVPSLTEEELNSVFLALSYDNPSLLCLGATSELSSEGAKSYFIPEYSNDVTVCNQKTDELNKKTKSILNSVSESYTEYEKELFVHDYICKNCVYDLNCDLSSGSTAYDALISGKTVCEGYARAAQLLLNELNIKNYLITGDAVNSDNVTESHMWNIVSIDGKNYHLDLTWDDYDETDENLSHSYFNLSDSVISANHFNFEPKENNCISTDSNYFVKNGTYFDNYNSNVNNQIIKQAVKNINSGNAEIEISFSDKSAMDIAKKNLIDDSEIFNLLGSINKRSKKNYKNIKYTLDESINVLQFIFE